MHRSGIGRISITVLALLALTVGASRAQSTPAKAPGPQTPPRAAQAAEALPLVTFSADGVTLVDAVRLTLTNDPNLKLAQSAMKRQEGVAQQQSGLFDLTLKIKASFDYRVQELPETKKEAQRKKRSDAQETVDTARAAATQTTRLVQLLQEASRVAPGTEQTTEITKLSAAVGAQLAVLDTLIANTPEPGKSALAQTRQTMISETLTGLQEGLANYNTIVSEAEANLRNWGAPPVDEFFSNAKLDVQMPKYFRSGLMVAPYFSGNLDSTSFVGKPISEDFGGKGTEDLWTFKAGLNLSFPLWRGRGATGFAAGERSALAQSDASRMAYQHQAAASALGTIRAYWDLRAAEDSLDAATRSVELAAKAVEVTTNLINAEELPRLELARAQASDARARSRLSEAQRRARDARVALVKAIGVAVADGDAALPRTKDAFPQVPDAAAVQQVAGGPLAAQALENRQDVAASRKLEEAGRFLDAGARRNVGPRLDLTAGSWMTALAEKTIGQAMDRWGGPSLTAGLEFEKPFGNNLLRGQAVQRAAELRQRQISAADLARTVRLDVLRLVGTLAETASRVQQADTAARLYRQTVEAELERFRAGETTLIDTLLSQQQMTDSLVTLAAAQRDLAQLIAELRYQTGTLVNGFTVLGPSLVTVPPAGGR